MPGMRSGGRPSSWRGLLVATAALGAIPFALWTVANPVAGAVVLGLGCAVAGAVRVAVARSEPTGRDGSSTVGSPAWTSLDARTGGPPANPRR